MPKGLVQWTLFLLFATFLAAVLFLALSGGY